MPQSKILVGTKKGAFVIVGNPVRKKWSLHGPILLGNIVYHFVQDPRDRKKMLIAAKAGHLGPTIYRSVNAGRTFHEVSKPPAFTAPKKGMMKLTVDHVFWLTPGLESQPGVWYAGTSPQGLFRSDDDGDTWQSVDGFNKNPMRDKWCGDPAQGPPDGARLHSINIDPRNSEHMYVGCSSGGVFETTDGGLHWTPLNKGCVADFLPDKDAEYGHDPHCVRIHPLFPDRIYQQNHCGIYRMDRLKTDWKRIGKNMPRRIGDIGFPMVLHPRDPNICWVFPMDGTEVWPRTSPGGKPAVFMTRDGGKKWTRQANGLPLKDAWFTVYRQAMTADDRRFVGVYFGTTSGEIYASRDEANTWRCIARHLPRIHSLEMAV